MVRLNSFQRDIHYTTHKQEHIIETILLASLLNKSKSRAMQYNTEITSASHNNTFSSTHKEENNIILSKRIIVKLATLGFNTN